MFIYLSCNFSSVISSSLFVHSSSYSTPLSYINLFVSLLCPGFPVWFSWNWQATWLPEHIFPFKERLLCYLVLLYKNVYENLSKSVALRPQRCALFRLASAKVWRDFQTTKTLHHIFSKKINNGGFWEEKMAEMEVIGSYRGYREL